MNYQDASSRSLLRSLCDKSLGVDVICEYPLPDYEEEIRRLLRVNVTLLPPVPYVGAGNASFSGSVRFDMLYLSPEGKLCTVRTTEGYELSAPLDKDTDVDYADEILAFCDVTPESVVSRVLAPRKLSLKCRLHAKVRAYGHSTPTETLTGDFSGGGIERLAGMAEAAFFASALSEDIEISDEITPTRTGETTLVGADGGVHVLEATCEEGAVLCRGELLIKLLLCTDGGTPYTMQARIPFSERVEGDGFRGGMSARAFGEVAELSCEIVDGVVQMNAALRLSAEAQENRPVPYTRDLYSSVHRVETTHKRLTYPHATLCKSGNFTQSRYEPLESYGIPTDAEIIDLTATACADEAICDRGKWALVGESRMSLLLLSGGEYKTVEIPLPFRYELEGECGEVECLASELHMTNGRARIDGGRLSLECEMGVSLRLCTVRELTALDEASFGEPVPECEDYVVCFPSPKDTLWDVAKRYHAPLARLRALNKLDENDTLGDYLIVNG